jgi:hypothetical protein
MIHYHAVDLQWADLFPPAVDDFLDSSCQAQIAQGVQSAFIPGAEPPIDECLGVGIRVVFITTEDVAPVDPDLARFARWEREPSGPSIAMAVPVAIPAEPGNRAAGGNGFEAI